jgi:hypothetical protein
MENGKWKMENEEDLKRRKFEAQHQKTIFPFSFINKISEISMKRHEVKLTKFRVRNLLKAPRKDKFLK